MRCESSHNSSHSRRLGVLDELNFIGGHELSVSDKISLTNTPRAGLGWVCVEKSICPGETLIGVPHAVVVNAQNVELDCRIGRILGPLRSAGLDDRGVLALWYLYNRKVQSNEWLAYFNLLPNYYTASRSHMLLCDDAIPGTAVSFTVERMRLNISRQLRSIISSIRQLDPTNPILAMNERELEQEWKLCHTLVLSRSGLFDGISMGTRWTDQPIAVIPGIDFINHSDNPNSKIVRDTDGSVRLVATRAINPGAEITIAYWPMDAIGNLSLEQVLFTFGFIGGTDRFVLPMISFDGSDTDKKRALQRLVFIESVRSSEVVTTVYTDDVDAAVDYFTIECMPEAGVVDLVSSIMMEGGVKTKSRRILASFRDKGVDKLRSEVVKWQKPIVLARVTHPNLVEYQRKLSSAIDSLLSELS